MRALYWWSFTALLFLPMALLNANYHWTNGEYITIGYIFVFSMPLWIAPLARVLMMNTIFVLFRRK